MTRQTPEDPREQSSAPTREVPHDVFMAAKDAAYGALSYLDMDYTAHRPVQGDAAPKVIAYWIASAVLGIRGHGQCGCCDSISYLESILVGLHADGPDLIGKPEWDLVCKLIDELGK